MKNWVLNKEIQQKYFIPFCLLFLNFILKLWHLDSQSIANDEPFSIFVAQMNVSAIISELSLGNNPPLFEIMLHFWVKIFGISPFSVRFLPFLFSVATVVIIYKLGRSFFNFQVALLASLIFSFSNYHLFFAHETRVYSFLTLMTCISMYSFFKIVNNYGNHKDWIILVFANLLLCYSHYFGIFIPLIQGISILIIQDLRIRFFSLFIIAKSTLIILYTPMLPVVFKRFNASSNGTWVQPSSLEDFYTMLWRFSNVPVLTVSFILILITALIKWFRKKDEVSNLNVKIMIIWFLFPYMFMFIVSLKYWTHPIPVFIDRYVIFISIAYYFCIAFALIFLFKNVKMKTIFYMIPILIMFFTFELNVGNKRNVKAVVAEINRQKQNGAKLIICPEFYDLNFAYYLIPDNFYPQNDCFKDSLIRKMALNGIFPVRNKTELGNIEMHKTKKILYLDVEADFLSPGNEVFDSLNIYYRKYKLYKYPDIFKLYVFEK